MDFMLEPVNPKWRTGVGMLLILLVIAAWGIAVVLLATLTRQLPFVVELLFYAVAGIGWIFPIRPLLTWMAK
jgi:uncharacterized membrane protein